MTITSDDIYALLRQGESASVEIKKCSDSLPRSVWETYSAFANTRGGVILLGITEHKDLPPGMRLPESRIRKKSRPTFSTC